MDINISCEINTGTIVFAYGTVMQKSEFMVKSYKSQHESSIFQSTYPWTHTNVFSKDPRDYNAKLVTYTVNEVNVLLADKANKTGETTHGNIATLNGDDGDLVDSEVHPDDLVIHVIDMGEF